VTLTERPTAAADGGRLAERARIRDGVRYCLLVFLGVRLGLAVLAVLGLGLVPHTIQPVSVPGWPAPPFDQGAHVLFTVWERFDGLWFLRIATGGYVSGDGSAAFFPLYPVLIRIVSPILGGHPFAASLVISNACFAGSLVVLYFLTASELSEGAARKAVLYLALFPTAFFFLAPYSESPFLLATLASFWGARRGKWWMAGVCGALASATRNLGVLMVPSLAIEALHQWSRPEPGEKRSPLWPKLTWSAVAGLGTLAYLLYWKVRNGDLLATIHQQVNWQREGSTPWHTIAKATREAFQFLGVYPGGYFLLDWLIVIPCILLAGYAFLRFRPSFGFYAAASIVVPLCFIFPDRPFLSVPRFLAVLFPIHWALADLAERGRIPHHVIVGVSAALLGALTILFVNWYYVF
jgi:hypothetical protein